MLEKTNSSQHATFTPLLEGIYEDGRQLIRQEFALVRSELKYALNKAKIAAIYFMLASVLTLAGIGLFLVMLVQLLAMQVPALPAWVCYGVVALLAGTGALLFLKLAKNKIPTADSLVS